MKYTTLLHHKNIKNPYGRVIEKYLLEIIKDVPAKVIIENLKSYNKHYTKQSFDAAIKKSTLDTRSFLKFMLASEKKEFTIKNSRNFKKN